MGVSMPKPIDADKSLARAAAKTSPDANKKASPDANRKASSGASRKASSGANKKASSDASRKASSGANQPPQGQRSAIDLPHYPGAQPLPVEKAPRNIEIIELISQDSWPSALSFYERSMSEQGWQIFEVNRLADRGALSFRRQEQTVTVLAAQEADATHIRIYIQKK